MSYTPKLVYSENPYIDIIVYQTQLLGINTVLKMQDQAERYETLESHKYADKLIMCKEGTMSFDYIDEFSEVVLRKLGLVGIPLYNAMTSKDAIPENLRAKAVQYAAEEFIANYEDQNYYYRTLSGLPPIGKTHYVQNLDVPEEIKIDFSKPIHLLSDAAIKYLDTIGKLDEIYEIDHEEYAYIKYLDKKIDPYAARRASQFSVLYIPSLDSAEIEKEYRDRLEVNKEYVLKSVYSYAYKFDSDYYDNIMAVFIVLNAMMDVLSRVQEFIARREVFDLRTCEYIFNSNGVDFFPRIPLRYQIKMVKNLHTLLKYKSTSKCMVDICSLFGFDNIKVFKYYMLRTRNYNRVTGDYSFTGDSRKDFDLKFVKIPIDEPMADYVRDPAYYIDYDEITEEETWDGGLRHKDVKKQMLDQEFNYSRTKYLSIDSLYDIAKLSVQQSYFFNMLYDNYELEDELVITIPAISTQKKFNVADVFIFMTILTHYFYGNKDLIFDTQGKVLHVNGFNFKQDLAALAEDIAKMHFDKECQEYLKQFIKPEESIPSMKTLMDIFVNNMNIRKLLLEGMRNADSKRHYEPYKKLYDALMTVELTFDHFKNPITGELDRDVDGDATYSAFLARKDPVLYEKIVEILLIDDEDSQFTTITNLIDNICYILEEWINADEFAGIFYGLPGVSIDAVKQYIMWCIDFYKSYKAHILGINTVYFFDDPNEGYIHVIDDLMLHRYFEKDETIALIDKMFGMAVDMSHEDKIKILERVYFDISTWKYHSYEEYIQIRDYSELFYGYYKYDFINLIDGMIQLSDRFEPTEMIRPIDTIGNVLATLYNRESLDIDDHVYLYPFWEEVEGW